MDDRENKTTAVDYAALVARARTGDQDAYTALYEATSQELYRTVRSMVRTEDQTLDIQQEAYVYAFTHLDQLGEPAKFRAWLHTIAVNRTRSVLRRQTALLFSELETEEGSGLPELADESPDNSPELALERKETAELIREILDSLSAGQRLLVGLYYYEQIPLHKIAEDLGVSAGTVKTQLFRSRKKIESAVEQLQKKGVKLFGLSPLPFLLALLRKAEPAAEETEKAILAGSLSKAGIVAESAAVHLGRSFFQTALGRVTLGLIAALSVAGGVLGYSWIKNHLMSPLGDVRPTETVESAEDLSTEPVTRNDSEEDLFPEPSTAPTEPTEITTEPVEITTEAPEITTEPGESPTEPDPGPQPGQPTPTEPQPTQPGPTEPAPQPTNPTGPGDPGVPDPTDPTDPTEEPSTEPTEKPTPSIASSRITDYYWGSSGTTELYDIPWGNSVYIQITVLGEEQPTVTTDNSELIRSITPETNYNYTDPTTGEHHYYWAANIGKSGTGHVYCFLGGEVQGVLTLQNPEYEPRILHSYWNDNYNNSDKSFIGKVGDKVKLYLQVQGKEKPVLTVDNSAVAQIVREEHLEGSGTTWNTRLYVWEIQLTGPGSTELSCTLGGTIAGSFTVTAEEAVVEP